MVEGIECGLENLRPLARLFVTILQFPTLPRACRDPTHLVDERLDQVFDRSAKRKRLFFDILKPTEVCFGGDDVKKIEPGI
jgi:hypothetical protein